jgi:polar amino acid transport system substrate-binding protein
LRHSVGTVVFYFIFLIFMSVKSALAHSLPTEIKLASTNWCPYTCLNSDKMPGIVNEYVSALLKREGTKTTIDVFPWSRAISLVRKGDVYQGLLTAVPEEAPDLLFTTTPIMTYQVCVYTRHNSKWIYQMDREGRNLKGVVGVIANYGYGGEIGALISRFRDNGKIHEAKGVRPLSSILKMVQAHRIDAFVEDNVIVNWEIKNRKLMDFGIRKAGCAQSTPFYLALNKDFIDAEKIISYLSSAFGNSENQILLKRIARKYVNP